MKTLGHLYCSLSIQTWVEQALASAEVILAANGALCTKRGKYNGRSPADKFIVDEPNSPDEIH